MTPATTGMYEAVVNGTVTHSGDLRLARHVANATVRTDNRGTRIYKEHKHSARRIDLASALSWRTRSPPSIRAQLYWYDESS